VFYSCCRSFYLLFFNFRHRTAD